MLPSRHRHTTPLRSALLFTCVLLLGFAALFLFSHKAVAPSPNTNINSSPANSQPSTNNNSDNSTAVGRQSPANTNISTLTKRYHSDELGFTLAYPADWQVEQSSSGTGDAQVTNFALGKATEGVTVTVMPSSLQGIIGESFSLTNEQPVTVNGVAATRAHGTSAKDGSAVDLLFFTRSDKLFLLNGKASLVDLVGPTIQFTK